MTSLKLTCCIFSILFSFSLLAQDQMERLYRSNRQNAGLDVVQTSDEGYLFLSSGREPDSTEFHFYTVTKLDNKGNVSWSKDYQFEEKINQPFGTLTLLEADSFIISGVFEYTALVPRFLMKCDPSGEVMWTKGFEDENSDNLIFVETGELAINYRNGFLITGLDFQAGPFGQLNVNLGETDADGNLLWAKRYSKTQFRMTPRSVQLTRDSGAVVCGLLFNTDPGAEIFLIKTDSIGEIEWSRQYGDTLTLSAVVQTPDDGYLISGASTDASNKVTGVLIKTDTIGLVQWTMNIDFETDDTVVINDLIMTADGNAVISGVLLESVESFAFMVKLDMQGNIIWKRKYKASTQTNPQSNGLLESSIGGFVYLTTSDESGEQVGPYLIKTDDSGETLCDTAIMEDLFFPITISTDTLELTETDMVYASPDVIVTDTLNYGGFNPPTLTLETFGPFCPDEIFSVTYDATVDGAIEYEWSTGETTPMITVSEIGEYMVTVTIGEDYCYLLCTSASISEIPLPEVTIQRDGSGFCNTGEVIYSANATGAIENIEWSTGETQTTSIVVEQFTGTYSVTVTDQCNNTATAGLATEGDPTPGISIAGTETFCETGTDTLFANVSPVYLNNIMWSTGESTPLIVVEAQGIYSVTVSTEFCEDNSAEFEITCPVDLEVPNTFTPNNDDINDSFKPMHPFTAADFLEYRFEVYNRWGDKVFETTNPDEAWDGTIKGENAVSDVYMWKLSGRTEFFEISDPEDRAGDVTLIR